MLIEQVFVILMGFIHVLCLQFSFNEYIYTKDYRSLWIFRKRNYEYILALLFILFFTFIMGGVPDSILDIIFLVYLFDSCAFAFEKIINLLKEKNVE